MNSKKKDAINYFMNHYNCCQAVVLAHKDLIREYHPELTDESLERMSVAFGGGIAGSGEACGALTGLCMVLGLISTGDFKEPSFKKQQRDEIKELMDSFDKRFGSILCRDIKDKFNPDPYFDEDTEYKEIFDKKPCSRCVSYAAELIEEFLDK